MSWSLSFDFVHQGDSSCRPPAWLALKSIGHRHRDNREETIPVRHDVLNMADQLIIQGLPEIDEVEVTLAVSVCNLAP